MPPSEPLYMDVVRTITAQVRAGVRKPGERLPSQTQLAEEFEVGLTTVKTALMILEHDGVLVGRQGKGIYVAGDSRPRR